MITGCQWETFKQATIRFCEADTGGCIRFPSDTWTNLIYIVVGIIILYLTKKERRWNLYGAGFGFTAIAVGIGSFLFHATGTAWGSFLDVGAMLSFILIMCVGATDRYEGESAPTYGQYIVMLILSLVALYFFPGKSDGIYLFIGSVIFFLTYEVQIFLKLKPWRVGTITLADMNRLGPLQTHTPIAIQNSTTSKGYTMPRTIYPYERKMSVQILPLYRPLWWLMGLFAISMVPWTLDIIGAICDPNNHILTGHGMWHLINAWCFLMAYRFYRSPPTVVD